jgi:hypothetical protein
MSKPQKDEFLYAPEDVAHRGEGFTESRIELTGEAREQQEETEARLKAGLGKLTMNGGRGDGLSAIVGGELLTVKESVALAIARDMCRDAEQRTGKPLKDIPILELNEGIHARIKGRATTAGAVMAELGRLQNTAKYGDTVRRR